jgi:mRNA interferase MazF
MKSGIRQGELYLVPFPFSDLSGMKLRPVLVLSKNNFFDVIVCGITSNLRELDNSIIINNDSLKHGSIPRTSMIKVDKIFTLEKNLFSRKIGFLKDFNSVREILFRNIF